MSAYSSKPVFRTDLDVLAQASPGQPDRYLVKDPARGAVLEMTGKDVFLCRQMDGQTSLAEIAARFTSQFNLAIQPSQVAAFVETLRNEGFLTEPLPADAEREWDRMKPLPLPFDRWCPAIARAFAPLAGWPMYILLILILFPAFGMLVTYAPLIWYYLADFLTHLESAGASGFSGIFSVQSVLQIIVFFTFIPFLREVVKAVVCCHYGARVPEIRYGWFMRFIPRCIAGIHGVVRLEKREQAMVLSAGLLLELVAFSIGMVGLGIFMTSNPMYTLCTSLAIGAAVRFLLTANPLGEQDGGVLVGLWRDEPDLHRRSVNLFRAWLFRHPMPEPLEERRRRNLIVWGALSDLAVQGITVAILSLLGYLLIQWMGGLGAVLLLLLVYLKYERTILSWLRGVTYGSSMARTEQKSKKSFWMHLLLVLAGMFIVSLIPYPYDVSGEFRIQPVAKREIRAEVAALVDSIPVAEGTEVKAGDLIAQLSTRLIEKDLEVNRSALRREREVLRAMEAGARPEDIAIIEQSVKGLETKLRFSEETLVRTEELYKKEHISDQDYQNVLQVRDLDRENLESARLSLASAKAGVREEEKEAQRAVIQSLEVTVKHLEDDLARTKIVTPIDGRVVTMFVQGRIGQQATPGDVIAVVEDVSRTIVRIALPEQHSGLVEIGAAVRVRPWAYSGRIFKGNVISIMPVVLDKNRDVMQEASMEQEHGMVRNLNMPEDLVVPVLAEIDNEGIPLRSEMTGYAKIDAGWKPLGYAFLGPVIRFIKVQVWSWIP